MPDVDALVLVHVHHQDDDEVVGQVAEVRRDVEGEGVVRLEEALVVCQPAEVAAVRAGVFELDVGPDWIEDMRHNADRVHLPFQPLAVVHLSIEAQG